MLKKILFLACCVLFLAGAEISGQSQSGYDLSLNVDDFQLEMRAEYGFHLFVRKKPDINSVLLTESTRDPSMREDNFAYRAPEWNPINGNEVRLLNGVPIPREDRIYSLISSTVVEHPELGPAFHIFVPWVVSYGFDYTRHGEALMINGAYINVRAFSLPYGDYRGRFADNPFVLEGIQRPVEKPNKTYMQEAEEAFIEIAKEGDGNFVYVTDPSDLIVKIEEILVEETGKSLDIVLCIDSTGSMGRYIDSVKRMLIPMMRRHIAGYTDWRIGIVTFRDYGDAYLNKVIPFTKDFNLFQRNLNAIMAWGGGDIPEAVYEALYEGLDKYPWAAESRQLILVGDAPPHPVPRGKITKEMVYQMASEKDVKLNALLLPQ